MRKNIRKRKSIGKRKAKEIIKMVIILEIVVLRLLGIVIQVYAASYEVTYQGGEFFVSSEELLENNSEMMPGDTQSQTITVKNESDKTVKIYLQPSVSMQSKESLLEVLQINILTQERHFLWTSKSISKGSVNEKIEIAEFEPRSSRDITIETNLSTEANNACRDAMAEMEYIFLAEELEKSEDVWVPDTGDNTKIESYLNFIVFGVLIILLAFRKQFFHS
ncbi:MAG: hypothetical protein IJA07_04800 [Agathobacter sp.]|nr:hypothetical protein [Agathobacter sp.]